MSPRAASVPVTDRPDKPGRSVTRTVRLAVILAAVVLAVPVVAVGAKVAGQRDLGRPVQRVTSDAPAPGPVSGAVGWQVKPQGRITDVAVLPERGLVIYVEELARRSWRATAVDAATGKVRWRNARGNTAHIEAWAVTDAAVVLAYHHSASRLAWRFHRAASFEGLDPVSGKVLWTRHVYNLLGDRPGDYAPTLASPADNVVVARTEQGMPKGVDTRTGEELWEFPGLNGCRTHEIVVGQAGVAVSQRCNGKERVQLVNTRTGRVAWKTDVSTSNFRLLAVGSNSVVAYQGGMVSQLLVLGPGGGYVSRLPCDCGDGEGLQAGVVTGTAFAGGTMGVIGVGGVVLVGGPFGLVGVDGGTGKILWQKPVDGGPVHKVLAQGADAHVVGGNGALLRVDPAGGELRTLIPGAPGALDPDAIVAPAGGYLAAGSATKGLGFSPLP